MIGSTAPAGLAPHSADVAGGHGWRVLGILCLLMGFASIYTDIYLPGMPTMSRALGADMGTAEWTVSGYLIGFALGQLFWGPVGDRFGRRLPVVIGIVLFVLGSAGCAMATGIWWVIAARVVQAAGASAGVVLGRAMVRDLYQGPRAGAVPLYLRDWIDRRQFHRRRAGGSPARRRCRLCTGSAAQYGSGIFSSALIGAFANGTPAPMGTMILVTALASLACLAGLRTHDSTL